MLIDFQNIVICPEISEKINTLLTKIGKKSSMTILDAGCGNGQFSQLLISLGVSNVVGVDFSHNMIKGAKRRSIRGKFAGKLDLALGKLENLNFKDETFDVAFMFGVLEHLENLNSVFREIRRVLRNGGKLILGVPRKNSSSYFTFLLLGRSPKWWGTGLEARHILNIREKTEFYRFFDRKDIGEMIAIASMRQVASEPMNFFHYGGIGASLVEKMLRNKIQIKKILDIIFERVFRTPSGELVLLEKTSSG